MKIKSILLSLLLGLGAGKAAAQQITVSPIPQNIEWGAKAFDGTATYKFTGSEEADADAVAALTAFRAPQTGSADVEIIIGERGDAAVAAYESEIPAKAEGYYLKVQPGKVVIAGNDANGTFYGVQTFLQVAAQPEVMQVTVKDWPDMLERGVVEGFYGNNWSQTDRIRQFQFYGRNKMNVYIYGPKDDPYHRYRWRENYPTAEANKMKELVAEAHKNKVNFVWAVHPGIDIKWNKTDSLNVIKKLEFMYGLGVRAFAVFFDDITGEGTSGVKQAQLLNYITDEFVRKHDGVQPLILCPTDYNRAWAGDTYLNALRDNMYKEVRIMWTGNSVVDFINKSDLEWVNPRIGRKAYIWLNYPVTDYCGRHLLMGPTFGDDLDIADMVSGYTSNPMEYAEASMLSLYSIADFTWHGATYDSNASWERAIKYLMPTHAEAFHVFCEHNVDLGANGHGLRRMNESVAFKAAAEAFKTAIANGYNAKAVESMKQQFAIITDAADELLANTDQPELTAEITPWVQVMKIVGQRGALTMALYDNLQAAEPEKFIENYLAITALEQQQKSVMSRDFEGSIMKVNPAVAELVVQPFIKEQLAALIAAYKKTYDYRLDVFPAELIEEGDYFIKYNNRYLSNTNAGSVGGNPSFLSSLDNVNPTRQYWHISLDP
ncbi:MAG: beta-N-acetylglucosaminidase domain-containing protein, partial [Bacteroidales bacterium]